MRQPVKPEGVFQRGDNRFLADDAGKRLRPVFPRDHL